MTTQTTIKNNSNSSLMMMTNDSTLYDGLSSQSSSTSTTTTRRTLLLQQQQHQHQQENTSTTTTSASSSSSSSLLIHSKRQPPLNQYSKLLLSPPRSTSSTHPQLTSTTRKYSTNNNNNYSSQRAIIPMKRLFHGFVLLLILLSSCCLYYTSQQLLVVYRLTSTSIVPTTRSTTTATATAATISTLTTSSSFIRHNNNIDDKNDISISSSSIPRTPTSMTTASVDRPVLPSQSRMMTTTTTHSQQQLNNHSKIPRVLIFTHAVHLLDHHSNSSTTTSTTTTTMDMDAVASLEWAELRTLQENVRRIIALHTTTNATAAHRIHTNKNSDDDSVSEINTNTDVDVRFLTDHDCIRSIHQWVVLSQQRQHDSALVWNPSSNPNRSSSTVHPPSETSSSGDSMNSTGTDSTTSIANELISYFQNETMGMYRADLCRGVALYETGGIYMDVDLGVRMNLFPLLLPSSEFVTVTVHAQSQYPGAFFQAFIAVVPYHDVIHRYIELFILYYRRTIHVGDGPIGVLLLKRAYDEIQQEQEHQLLLQQRQNTVEKTVSSLPATTQMTTRLQQTTELWQEILYLPQYHETIFSHVPIPTWGRTKRACKFVVVIPPTKRRRQQETMMITPPAANAIDDDENNNINQTSTEIPQLIVPMYSRIAGSRMCPI